ncbi:MAG: B12-binding domain-containing protein [Dehalococcoidia bacterium]
MQTGDGNPAEAAVDEPCHNIRAVERLTGVLAATLRSWERRYGFPLLRASSPPAGSTATARCRRSAGSRRRPSGVVRVAQAVHWASGGETTAGGTATAAAAPPPAVVRQPPPALHALAEKLLEAVSAYDEQAAEAAPSAGFARMTPDVVLTEVLTPTLRAVGDCWARGELPTSAEHFATNIVRRRLFALQPEQPPLPQGPPVVLACVPGEHHELGLLSCWRSSLRWHGRG